jgi:hypothetical protein
MIIRKALPLFFVLLLGGGLVSVAAQEDGGELPIDSDWSGVLPSLYARGDQIFTIGGGGLFPVLFLHHDGSRDPNIYPGAALAMGYTYYLSPLFFIGGELGGTFAGTKGKNMVFFISLGFKAGIQLVLGRFEFPLSLTVGACPQKFLDDWYLGLVLKPSVSAYYRFSPDWSVGINTGWWWIPQWTGDRTKDVYGNLLDVTLAIRYQL